MKNQVFRPVLAITVGVLLVTGCTPNKTEEFPTPVATPTVEDTSTDEPYEPTSTPTLVPESEPKPEVKVDVTLFKAKPVKGVSPEDAEQILDVAAGFAIHGFSPEFLNGSWADKDMEEIASGFSPFSTTSVVAAFSAINPSDPESANSLSAVAALFSPSKKITATPMCLEASEPQDCLYSDLVLSAPEMSIVDQQVEVKFTASSTRDLLLDGKPASSDVIISHTLFFTQDENDKWAVNGVNNTFTYGKVEER